MTDVYIVSGVRTAVGTFGGSLKDTTPSALVAAVAKEAVGRAKVDPAQIGLAVFGQIVHTDPRDDALAPEVRILRPPLGASAPRVLLSR